MPGQTSKRAGTRRQLGGECLTGRSQCWGRGGGAADKQPITPPMYPYPARQATQWQTVPGVISPGSRLGRASREGTQGEHSPPFAS